MAMNESCQSNQGATEAASGLRGSTNNTTSMGSVPVASPSPASRSAIPTHSQTSEKKKKKKLLKKTISGGSKTPSNGRAPSPCSPAPSRNHANNNYAAPHTPIASAKRPRHKPTPVNNIHNNSNMSMNVISTNTAPLTPRNQMVVEGTTTPMSTTPMAATPPRSASFSSPAGATNAALEPSHLPPASAASSKFSPMHPPTSARLQAQQRGVVEESKLYLDLDDKAEVGKLAPSHSSGSGTLSMNASIEEETEVDEEAAASSGSGRWGMGQLFSPVLNFLGGGGNTNHSDAEEERGSKRRPKQQRLAHQPGEEEIIQEKIQETTKTCQATSCHVEDEDGSAETADETVDEDGDVTMSMSDGRIRVKVTPDANNSSAGATDATTEDAERRDKSDAPLLSPSSTASTEHNQVPSKGSTATAETEVSTDECYEDTSNQGQVTVHACNGHVSQEQEQLENHKTYEATTTTTTNNTTATTAAEEEDDEEEDEFNPYLFIKHLPPYHTVAPPWAPMFAASGSHNYVPIHSRNVNGYPFSHINQQQQGNGWYALPPKDKTSPPISLVLDLDETLVHCTVEDVPDADLTFPVLFGGIEYTVRVKLRPHLAGFLRRVSQRFEVIVFTASQRVYADELLNRIDPHGKYIQHRLFRESCLAVEGNYLKDLHVLGPSRSLRRTVLVDNSPHAFGYQIDNGIPIESWFDDPHDSELLKLEEFLEGLHGVPDVRQVVRSKFRTHLLVHNA